VTELKQESMYELVTRIQRDISCLKQGQRDFRQEMSSVRGQVHVAGDLNNLRNSVNQMDVRLERIETRLELRELAESQARFEPHP